MLADTHIIEGERNAANRDPTRRHSRPRPRYTHGWRIANTVYVAGQMSAAAVSSLMWSGRRTSCAAGSVRSVA